MKTDLYDYRDIDIYVDEKLDLAVFPYCKNPNRPDNVDPEDVFAPPPCVPSDPFVLEYPYTTEQVADIINRGIEAWCTGKPYVTSKSVTLEEKLYGIKGFKNASIWKKVLVWDGQI